MEKAEVQRPLVKVEHVAKPKEVLDVAPSVDGKLGKKYITVSPEIPEAVSWPIFTLEG